MQHLHNLVDCLIKPSICSEDLDVLSKYAKFILMVAETNYSRWQSKRLSSPEETNYRQGHIPFKMITVPRPKAILPSF